MKGKELLRRLRRCGVIVLVARGKGGHYWISYKGSHTSIPMHGDSDIGPNLIKKICKQLGLDPKEVV